MNPARPSLIESRPIPAARTRGAWGPGGQDAASTKGVFIDTLFTTIAARYDRFNRLASLGLDQRWRRRLITECRLRPGMRVLDVCTGTGDLALLSAARTNREGMVVGLDFNEAMLQGARRKQQAQGFPVQWLRGDAQGLPFQTGSFDRVCIGFSTRNLSDLGQGFREMLRVLKPGGTLLVLETGRPANPLMRAGHLLFLGTVVRVIGVLLTGRIWPFTYLATSVRQFLSPAECVALLTACGAEARAIPLSLGLASLYLAQKPYPA